MVEKFVRASFDKNYIPKEGDYFKFGIYINETKDLIEDLVARLNQFLLLKKENRFNIKV